jgi:hypothetical protein
MSRNSKPFVVLLRTPLSIRLRLYIGKLYKSKCYGREIHHYHLVISGYHCNKFSMLTHYMNVSYVMKERAVFCVSVLCLFHEYRHFLMCKCIM